MSPGLIILLSVWAYAVVTAWRVLRTFRALRDRHVRQYGAASVNVEPVRVAHLRHALRTAPFWPLTVASLLLDGGLALGIALSFRLKKWAGHE